MYDGIFLRNIKLILSVVLILSTFSYGEDDFEYEYKTGNYFDTDLAWNVIKQSFETIPSDLYNIASNPFRNPGTTLKYVGLVGGLVMVDKPLTRFYQDNVEDPLDIYRFPTLFTPTEITAGADGWLVYGSIAHYLAGFALGDEKSQVTAIMAMKAMTYSYLFDHVILKSITGRRRPMNDLANCIDSNPDHTCDPYDFSPFQTPTLRKGPEGRTSMPSFHLTMYFSMAKVYQEMYDDYWLPYGVLAVVFASNIKGHQHWVSDMVAGGLIGTMIGHEVVSNYKNKYLKKKSDFTVFPTSNGVGINYRF